ncbi:MAG: hypothetical protein ACKVZ0_21125 [Gemmatimonadales bacterium]
MKDNTLTEGEVPHLRQTPVQFAVLGQHPPGRVLEIGGRLGDEIPNGGAKLVDGNVETLRGLTELTLGIVGWLTRVLDRVANRAWNGPTL